MVILATHQREVGSNPLKRANCTFDVNGEMKFSVKIARSYWTKDMTYGNLVYIPDTESVSYTHLTLPTNSLV